MNFCMNNIEHFIKDKVFVKTSLRDSLWNIAKHNNCSIDLVEEAFYKKNASVMKIVEDDLLENARKIAETFNQNIKKGA